VYRLNAGFRHLFHRAVLFEPRIASVAHNLQQPSAGIPALVAAEKTVRTQQRLLCHIFGITAAAQEPARQVERGIKMRHHDLLEARPVLPVHSGLSLRGSFSRCTGSPGAMRRPLGDYVLVHWGDCPT